jgi:hypothetical protein
MKQEIETAETRTYTRVSICERIHNLYVDEVVGDRMDCE